uniref:Uncharacterized protein n=1 Tax=Cucumis melo TaxID=3656 RepID=A0A9I9EA81_CUCME
CWGFLIEGEVEVVLVIAGDGYRVKANLGSLAALMYTKSQESVESIEAGFDEGGGATGIDDGGCWLVFDVVILLVPVKKGRMEVA